MLAASNGNSDMVTFFLENGCDVNRKDKVRTYVCMALQWTPLENVLMRGVLISGVKCIALGQSKVSTICKVS